MPNRIIRDWTDSDAVDLLSCEAERFFTRLIMKVDDYGRFYASPKRLRVSLFPLKDSIRDTDVSRWLKECESVRSRSMPTGLVRCYDVTGERFLAIMQFKQRLRQMEERFPAPPTEWPSNDGQPSDRRPSDDGVETKRNETETETKVAGVMLRIGSWFNRRPETKWDDREIKAVNEVLRLNTSPEDWNVLESYYKTQFPKDRNYLRRDIKTLLNNWNGEIDRAKKFLGTASTEKAKNGFDYSTLQ